jgi:AraC family transcriptional regulator
MTLATSGIPDPTGNIVTLEVRTRRLESGSDLGGPLAPASTRSAARAIQHVITLLDAALGQLQHPEAAHSALLAATILLRQHAIPDEGQTSSVRPVGLLAWQIRRIREFIDANLSSRITVPQLAAQVHLSEGHFSRAFRQAVGDSPHAYIINCRVQAAAAFMMQSDATLSEIAIDCGFTDQAHLSKHFRDRVGQTPAAWKRARRAYGGGATPRAGLFGLQATMGIGERHGLRARTAVELHEDILGV